MCGSPADGSVDVLLTCEDGHFGVENSSSRLQVVKNAFSWKFHFSAYNVCPDKSFWRGKKSSLLEIKQLNLNFHFQLNGFFTFFGT